MPATTSREGVIHFSVIGDTFTPLTSSRIATIVVRDDGSGGTASLYAGLDGTGVLLFSFQSQAGSTKTHDYSFFGTIGDGRGLFFETTNAIELDVYLGGDDQDVI